MLRKNRKTRIHRILTTLKDMTKFVLEILYIIKKPNT